MHFCCLLETAFCLKLPFWALQEMLVWDCLYAYKDPTMGFLSLTISYSIITSTFFHKSDLFGLYSDPFNSLLFIFSWNLLISGADSGRRNSKNILGYAYTSYRHLTTIFNQLEWSEFERNGIFRPHSISFAGFRLHLS